MAVYNASKAAQQSLNETLRIELEPFGVRVINVVTGAIDTPIMTRSLAAGNKFQLPPRSIYQVIFDRIKARADGTEKVPRMSTAKYAKVSTVSALYDTAESLANVVIVYRCSGRSSKDGSSMDRSHDKHCLVVLLLDPIRTGSCQES